MIPAHLHNLTDDEFVRLYDNTDDPVLKEALRRIEANIDDVATEIEDLRAEVKHLADELNSAQDEAVEAWDEVARLETYIQDRS